MTRVEQRAALQLFGYTSREAEFIVLAALHSGYFLRRQFSPNGGEAADRFSKKVVAFGHATTTVYTSNTHVYHLCYKPLYAALGQVDSKHRRPHEPFYMRAKLMGFDYVLAHRECHFLPTEEEKIAYFCGERGIQKSVLPTKTYAGKDGTRTERYFVDKYPIRVDDASGKMTFCYIDDGVFTTWLRQYSRLISELGAAEVVYIAQRGSGFTAAERRFAARFPSANGALPAELLAYFELRKDFEERGPAGRAQEILDRFRKLSRRYAEGRFEAQYRVWKGAAEGPVRAEKVAFSSWELPHSYAFFGEFGRTKTEGKGTG
jgi:hypothetical protein